MYMKTSAIFRYYLPIAFLLLLAVPLFNLKYRVKSSLSDNAFAGKKQMTNDLGDNYQYIYRYYPVLKLPKTRDLILIRTDYTDETKWKTVHAAITSIYEEKFRAYFSILIHKSYSTLDTSDFTTNDYGDYNFNAIFIADSITMNHPEHPVLCIDLEVVPGRSFRVIPSQLWGVENCFAVGNMDYDAYYTCRDSDGVFRDFPRQGVVIN